MANALAKTAIAETDRIHKATINIESIEQIRCTPYVRRNNVYSVKIRSVFFSKMDSLPSASKEGVDPSTATKILLIIISVIVGNC